MLILLLHAAATLLIVGVILVVQCVHYPLFRHVGPSTYEVYQAEHMRRITWIVAPLMSVELVTGCLLVLRPPPGVSTWQAGIGLGLLLVIWGTTALIQVPLHASLSDGFDVDTHRRLVRTNWLRTEAWLIRGSLVLWMWTLAVA